MAVTVLVPSALRGDAGGAARLSIGTDGTVELVLRELVDRWPRLGRRICDERGEIRTFVNVYVDGEDVRRTGGLRTEVSDGAEIQVIPSVAGG
jgi:molybdopterin converting factor small subunit